MGVWGNGIISANAGAVHEGHLHVGVCEPHQRAPAGRMVDALLFFNARALERAVLPGPAMLLLFNFLDLKSHLNHRMSPCLLLPIFPLKKNVAEGGRSRHPLHRLHGNAVTQKSTNGNAGFQTKKRFYIFLYFSRTELKVRVTHPFAAGKVPRFLNFLSENDAPCLEMR